MNTGKGTTIAGDTSAQNRSSGSVEAATPDPSVVGASHVHPVLTAISKTTKMMKNRFQIFGQSPLEISSRWKDKKSATALAVDEPLPASKSDKTLNFPGSQLIQGGRKFVEMMTPSKKKNEPVGNRSVSSQKPLASAPPDTLSPLKETINAGASDVVSAQERGEGPESVSTNAHVGGPDVIPSRAKGKGQEIVSTELQQGPILVSTKVQGKAQELDLSKSKKKHELRMMSYFSETAAPETWLSQYQAVKDAIVSGTTEDALTDPASISAILKDGNDFTYRGRITKSEEHRPEEEFSTLTIYTLEEMDRPQLYRFQTSTAWLVQALFVAEDIDISWENILDIIYWLWQTVGPTLDSPEDSRVHLAYLIIHRLCQHPGHITFALTIRFLSVLYKCFPWDNKDAWQDYVNACYAQHPTSGMCTIDQVTTLLFLDTCKLGYPPTFIDLAEAIGEEGHDYLGAIQTAIKNKRVSRNSTVQVMADPYDDDGEAFALTAGREFIVMARNSRYPEYLSVYVGAKAESEEDNEGYSEDDDDSSEDDTADDEAEESKAGNSKDMTEDETEDKMESKTEGKAEQKAEDELKVE